MVGLVATLFMQSLAGFRITHNHDKILLNILGDWDDIYSVHTVRGAYNDT